MLRNKPTILPPRAFAHLHHTTAIDAAKPEGQGVDGVDVRRSGPAAPGPSPADGLLPPQRRQQALRDLRPAQREAEQVANILAQVPDGDLETFVGWHAAVLANYPAYPLFLGAAVRCSAAQRRHTLALVDVLCPWEVMDTEDRHMLAWALLNIPSADHVAAYTAAYAVAEDSKNHVSSGNDMRPTFIAIMAAFVMQEPFDFAAHVTHTVDLLGHVEAMLSNDRVALYACAETLRQLPIVQQRDVYVLSTCRLIVSNNNANNLYTFYDSVGDIKDIKAHDRLPPYRLLAPKARAGSYTAYARLPRRAVDGDATDKICLFTHNTVAELDQPVAFLVGAVPHFAEYAAMHTWWQQQGQFSPGPGMRHAPLTEADLFVPTFPSI